MPEPDKRSREIIKCNIAGIVLNLILSGFKIIAGLSVNAHAILLDGFNSLSDLLTSVLSLVSVRLERKRPDKKHPMGFGRLEYIFSLFITIVILYIGGRGAVDSVMSIVQPQEEPEYNTVVVVIMCVSLAAKVLYGIVLRKKGRELSYDAMRVMAAESLGDGLIAAAVLAAIAIQGAFGVNIESWLCLGISGLILMTGVTVIRETMNKLIGVSVDPEFKKQILNLVLSEEGVLGVSNLVLHNYGQSRYVGSVHIMVGEELSALEVSKISRRLIRHTKKMGVTLTAVGITGVRSDREYCETLDRILEAAKKTPSVRNVTSLIIDPAEKILSFYVSCGNPAESADAELEAFRTELSRTFPEMSVEIINVIDM